VHDWASGDAATVSAAPLAGARKTDPIDRSENETRIAGLLPDTYR